MRSCFKTLRDNAKRRGKEFALTFEQFSRFCYETNYLAGKGRKSQSYSIDRRDNSKGYTIDNIRVLTVAENTRKKDRTLIYDWETNTAKVI